MTLIKTFAGSLCPPSFTAMQVKLLRSSTRTDFNVKFQVLISAIWCDPLYHRYVKLSGRPGWSTLHSKVTDAPFTTLEGYDRSWAGLGGSVIEIESNYNYVTCYKINHEEILNENQCSSENNCFKQICRVYAVLRVKSV